MMTRKSVVVLLIVALALLTLACQTVMGALMPETPTPPAIIMPTWTPTSTKPGPTPASRGGFQVTVDNQTPYEICYVYISDSDDDYWGDDVLGLDETILPGYSHVFDVPAGPHDLLIADCDEVTMGTAWALDAEVTLTFGGAGTVPLRVVNESSAFVCSLTLTHPASPPVIGETGLGENEVLEPSAARIFFVEPGLYNITAETCETGETYTVSALDVADEPTWTIPEDAFAPQDAGTGEPFVVRIVNETPVDICYVHISPASSDSWGDDWMGGDDAIAPGETRAFDVPGGVYDVAAFDCGDGVVATAWEVSDDVTLTPGDSGSVALRIVNQSSTDICYLYIAPSSEDMWGEDWMGEMELIPAGEGIRVFYVEPDTYDLLAEDCDGTEIASEYEADVTEDYVWTVSD